MDGDAVVEGAVSAPDAGGQIQVQQQEAPEQAQPEVTLQMLQEQIQDMGRQAKGWSGLQSRLDKLPEMTEKMLERRFSEYQKSKLSPEERQSATQDEQREKALREFTRREALEAFNETFKGKIAVVDQMEESQRRQSYMNALAEESGEQFDELRPIYKDIYERLDKELSSGDEDRVDAATTMITRFKTDPAILFAYGVKELSKRQTQQAQGVQSGRVQAAKDAGVSARGSNGNPAKGKQSLAQGPGESSEAYIKRIDAYAASIPDAQWKKEYAEYNASRG